MTVRQPDPEGGGPIFDEFDPDSVDRELEKETAEGMAEPDLDEPPPTVTLPPIPEGTYDVRAVPSTVPPNWNRLFNRELRFLIGMLRGSGGGRFRRGTHGNPHKRINLARGLIEFIRENYPESGLGWIALKIEELETELDEYEAIIEKVDAVNMQFVTGAISEGEHDARMKELQAEAAPLEITIDVERAILRIYMMHKKSR